MIKRRSLAKKEPKPKVAIGNTSALGRVKKQTITRFSINATKIYGTEVIEQRAIPDFRDGLKPVHRMVLWAAYKLGLHNSGGFKKAARTVGEVIGKYHPHGDKSAYDAMVGMAGTKVQGRAKGWFRRNCSVPLIEGQGNWGNFIDSAAAMRYTESKLSKFSDLFMLDPDYLAVMDYVPNYDDSEKVPVLLPAKLPVVLLNGYSSIAVAVAASSPPFHIDGVTKLTIMALNGEELTPKIVTKLLEPSFPYGGTCVSPKKDLYQIVKYGKGSLYFVPSHTVDERNKIMTFTSACPGLSSPKTVESFLNKMAGVREVGSVSDETDKRGPIFSAAAKRGTSTAAFESMVDQCWDIAVRSDSYDVGITIRQPDGSACFEASTIMDILTKWVVWRIEVEAKVIVRLIQIQNTKLHKLNTIRTAVMNIDVVLASLKIKKDKDTVTIDGKPVEIDAAAAFLMKKLKFSLEQADMILNMRVRSLRSTEVSKLDAQIKIEAAELNQLLKDQKKPSARAVRDLEKLSKVEL